MKFLAGFVAAIAAIIALVVLVIFSGTYNVAATVPESGLERAILGRAMLYSVRSRSGSEVRKTWSEEQLREGFKEYDEMCIHCHGAPGKEPGAIGKGLRPAPPNLAEAAARWSDSQLFWIVKNGVKMTGMPAFAPTHDDDTIWNIAGFVRELPHLSAEDYNDMERSAEMHEHHH